MRIILTILLFCLGFICWGQVDSIYLLPEATVTQSYLPATEFEFDSNDLAAAGHGTVTQLLQTESLVFVRNYGPGTLGTLTIGGGSAEQTNITWQGISLRNPMLGQIDVTLLPSDLFTSIAVQSKGGSAQYGNNQLTGGIDLKSELPTAKASGLGFSVEHGSWKRFSGHVKGLYSIGSTRSQTSVYGMRSENDYAFILNGLALRQSNASIHNLGVYHLSEIPLNSHGNLQIGLWWQDSQQEIPPTTVQNSSNANQSTTSLRSVIGWNNRSPTGKTEVRIGFVGGTIDFRNPARLEESLTRFGSLIAKADHEWWFGGSSSLKIGFENRLQHGEAGAYGGRQSENQLEVHSGFEWTKPTISWGFFLRQGLLDEELMPLTASLQSTMQLGKQVSLSAGVSRDLRYPTLNERYWQPGGKPDLNAESGWSQRLSVATRWKTGSWNWEMTAHAFNRTIENWILWSPQDELNIWTPDNLAKVWSRGGGLRTNVGRTFGDLDIQLRMNYTHTSSTNQIAIETPRLDKGDQLFYTPKNRLGMAVETSWPKWTVRYDLQYTGGYPGIIEEIESFRVGSIYVSRLFGWTSSKLRAWIRVNNLWDIQYRVVERRPMPGRNFRIGVSYDI